MSAVARPLPSREAVFESVSGATSQGGICVVTSHGCEVIADAVLALLRGESGEGTADEV